MSQDSPSLSLCAQAFMPCVASARALLTAAELDFSAEVQV